MGGRGKRIPITSISGQSPLQFGFYMLISEKNVCWKECLRREKVGEEGLPGPPNTSHLQ